MTDTTHDYTLPTNPAHTGPTFDPLARPLEPGETVWQEFNKRSSEPRVLNVPISGSVRPRIATPGELRESERRKNEMRYKRGER